MMKVVVVGLALGMMMVAGCASAPEEEPESSTTSEIKSNPRGKGALECQLGDGLYCGGNGVVGAVNVLYRCRGTEVRAAEQCVGPCTKMPDGVNDRCDQTAAVADAPEPAQTPELPRVPAPVPQAKGQICGTGLTCATTSLVGATSCRQSATATTSIFCCPVAGSKIINGRCVAPVPLCGRGLVCSGSPTSGASPCHQSTSTTTIHCCPAGKKISAGSCI